MFNNRLRSAIQSSSGVVADIVEQVAPLVVALLECIVEGTPSNRKQTSEPDLDNRNIEMRAMADITKSAQVTEVATNIPAVANAFI